VVSIDPGDFQTGKDEREERKNTPIHFHAKRQAAYS
jgi:hypothetical protein